MKVPCLKNAISDFKIFCTKIELKEQKVNFDLLNQIIHFDVLSHIYGGGGVHMKVDVKLSHLI